MAGIDALTPIQRQCYAPIAAGRDVVAVSETGSGKTLAYLLPLIGTLSKESGYPRALIVAPSRELAAQVASVARDFGVDAALAIGGASAERQIETLRRKPPVVVGTAARMLELYVKGKLKTHAVRAVVLDEADRLFADENIGSVAALLKTTLKTRQTLLFSATEPEPLFTRDPVFIRLGTGRPPASIEHVLIPVANARDKFRALRGYIANSDGARAVVFLSSPDREAPKRYAERMSFHGVPSAYVRGGPGNRERAEAVRAFRDGRARLLFASDLAARGLDFPDVTRVVNWDAPEDAEIYLHRAGRCGRMGGGGVCVSLAAPREMAALAAVAKKLGIAITPA
ncbi:MAG: DEAD/DEAH box helicase [Clostridiales bacterium]|jgi:superfamily II DNA/RNA helicase|nr:DEAD/DEAH box helicase [Clostridiales bacterium]